MRLHRLRLTGVKGVRDREVVFPDAGVVVVEGQNEAGKTTMIEALDLLFDEKDSSRKRHVLAMRPVGEDVPSAVEVEASSGPYRFVYRKQWFRKPSTVLTITSPRREDLTGTAAHDRARAILEETTDPDLWRALRLMQATPLGAPDLSGSTALADALEEAAGQSGASMGADGDSLMGAAESAYREFFTATGRPTGDYRDAELRVQQARHVRDAAEADVREVADDVRRHADVVREQGRLEAQMAQADEALAAVRVEWESAREVMRESERVQTLCDLARQAFDVAAERAQAREQLVAEVAALRRSAEEAQRAHDELLAGDDPQGTALASAQEELERARARRQECRRAAARADSDLALVGDLRDLVATGERLRRIEAAQSRVTQARAAEREARFVGSVADVEEAVRAVELARAEWRAGSPTWRVEELPAPVTIRVGDRRETVEVDGSGVLGEELEIALPGGGRLVVTPPVGGGDRAAAVTQAEARLAEVVEQAGVADLSEARRAEAAAADATQERREAEASLAAVLGGESVEDVRGSAEDLAAHVAELLEERLSEVGPDGPERDLVARLWSGSPTDPGIEAVAPVVAWITGHEAASTDTEEAALRAVRDRGAQARAREDEAEAEMVRWEAEVSVRARAAERARVEVARAEVAAQSARHALDDGTTRLAVAREKQADADLVSRLTETRQALAEAEERADAVTAEVRRHDPESLEARLEGATSAAGSLRRRYESTRDERLAIEARLRHAGEQGRADRLIEAESALARAERAWASMQRLADAARTLFDTLTRHRAAVTQTYVEPFTRAVSRLGRVVYGPGFDVEVTPGLTVEARILDDERIPYEALSSGAKEQLSILTRLACASLVDPEQGAPVVLDDALGYSDPAKVQRVCSAFSLVGGDAQVILLTCTPGRYAAIPDAHVIRL